MVEPSFTTQLEAMTLRDPSVHGSNGYEAATLRDQGYEQTEGAIGEGAVESMIKKREHGETN